ncbi:hypothetical protein [Alicyclobacillus acidocaldarius]|uniref:Uncharacterized protein n=2 Tax=Alicyclobacillaceae TaxID=186823 RepID=F8IE44_ALIAT|nr:hypothetical protein [Alicyclobacillus acidocaldarius]AEJ43886.1 hypothetical protein TC41_1972 [Alicyclobacillus acidocaldarius subsp. acidocaldarius Tc-4-1]
MNDMASAQHAIRCPHCDHTWFREERQVELDSSVVIKPGMPVEGRVVREQYVYICANCNQVLYHE